MRVVGTGADRVKLRWEPPQHNPEAVEEYVVYKRVGGGREWEEAVRTEETHALVKGLKSETKLSFGGISTDSDPIGVDPIKTYDFQVFAVNSTMMSLENSVSSETGLTKAAVTGLGVGTAAVGALFLPFVIGSAQEAFKEDKHFGGVAMPRSKERFLVGLSIAALPICIALAPVTLPALALATTMLAKREVIDEGDLTED